MGQQQSNTTPPTEFKDHKISVVQTKVFEALENQGLLKLRNIPFRNCIQISTEPILFLQCCELSLYELLQQRYNTNKLFPEQDIIKLAGMFFTTLAFIEKRGAVYSDLATEKIFYDLEKQQFKLFPVQLIKQSGYELMRLHKQTRLLAPELILAMRYNERNVQDQIYSKSNVFTAGMILLELATLLPSIQCYDPQNFDILDEVINERLQIVKGFYRQKIVKYIALMLDYDYTNRMSFAELQRQFRIDVSKHTPVAKPFSQFKYLPKQQLKPIFTKTSQKQNSYPLNKYLAQKSKPQQWKRRQYKQPKQNEQRDIQNSKVYRQNSRCNISNSKAQQEQEQYMSPINNQNYLDLRNATKIQAPSQFQVKQNPITFMSNTSLDNVLRELKQDNNRRDKSKTKPKKLGCESNQYGECKQNNTISEKTQEDSEDYSISRIREQIEKSRRLLEEFQKVEVGDRKGHHNC